jgi:hypothetical protein
VIKRLSIRAFELSKWEELEKTKTKNIKKKNTRYAHPDCRRLRSVIEIGQIHHTFNIKDLKMSKLRRRGGTQQIKTTHSAFSSRFQTASMGSPPLATARRSPSTRTLLQFFHQQKKKKKKKKKKKEATMSCAD